MLKDITIGQFYPAESLLHRMDPRTKLALTLLLIVVVFFAQSAIAYILLYVFLFLLIALAHIPFKFMLRALKPLLFIVIFTFLLNLLLTAGETLLREWWILRITQEGLTQAVYLALRLVFLVMISSLLTLTTSPILLTDGIESLLKPLKVIRFPAHELAMMMTIALRFIPTLLEETDKIMKAQMARGADFESGNLLRRAKAMVPLLVPLFISAFRRADELATAMEARCYRGGEGRTRLRVLRLALRDAAAFAVTALLGAVVVFDAYHVFW